MSDQAAGLRAWHQRQRSATPATPVVVLGDPTTDEIDRALATLPSPGGQGWRPVTIEAAGGGYRLLWFDAFSSDVAEIYRLLKRLPGEYSQSPVLLLVSAEPDAATSQMLSNLMETAHRFLGLTLTRDSARWLAAHR
ncbi:hypothetical protein [Kushneria phosphatilytica]|uniref:Uncharacterized protein n=1 Tax=Kushneria phosphatilytica TaxID=657387 RepID=A0A1S1NSH3_9GAMM|nr:hypothetical protein [Kushneria phosphatilytica]OHV08428.1 hypothetical protein BH688_14085 [Kushneria phosphatilytica]QEL09855.1 hypothetical protein FY550_01045 [Kushneria phosphatilytica]